MYKHCEEVAAAVAGMAIDSCRTKAFI